MKKLISFLILLILLLNISACSEEKYSREDIVDEMGILLEESQLLNEIYFGEGIPLKVGGHTVGVYAEADMSSFAAKHGLKDIESIRAKTAEVFSISMCAWLDELAFHSFKTGMTVEGSRYYEDPEKEGRIMVRTTAEVYVNGKVTYDLSSLTIVSQRKNMVNTELLATVTTPEGKQRSDIIKVDLIKEQDGWRLHSPTYFVYYDSELK